MECAEAKTRLSFVTATLNALRVGTPAPFEQHEVDGRARQVGRGAGVQGVGVVPQLAVQRRKRLPPGGGAHSTGPEHGASPVLHRDRRRNPKLAREVGGGRGGEERQVRLDDRVPPGEVIGERGPEGRGAQLECRPEVARIFAGNRVALYRQRHHLAQRRGGRAAHVLFARPAQPARSRKADRHIRVTRVRNRRLGERGGEPLAQWRAAGPERRAGERGEQQDQAEIGVGRRPAGGGFDGGADGGAERPLRRGGEGGPDGRGAREIVLVARIPEGREGGDVAGFGGAHLEQACELSGGDHVRLRRPPPRCATPPTSTPPTPAAATTGDAPSCPPPPGTPSTSPTTPLPPPAAG